MADDKIEIQITLDDGSVVKGLANIKKEVEGIKKPTDKVGDSISEAFSQSKVGAFANQLRAMNPTIAGLTAGVAVLATSFKLALDGEKIIKINKQFDLLATQAGLVSSSLRDGLVESAAGLADTEDLLKSASEAIVALGDNANRLPELFDLARKATQVFGGEAVDRFNQINFAIASTSAKQLKAIGIVIDTEAIYKNLAKQLGITSDQLTVQQKQFALLNATIDSGSKAFKSVESDNESLGASFTRLGVSIKSIFDNFAVSISTVFGPVFKLFIDGVNIAATSIAKLISSEDALSITSQTNASILKELKEEYKQNEIARRGFVSPAVAEGLRLENIQIKEQIDSLEKLIQKNEKASLSKKPKPALPELTPEQKSTAAQKRLEQELSINQQIIASSNAVTSLKIENSAKIEDQEQKNLLLAQIRTEQLATEELNNQTNLQSIRNQFNTGKLLGEQNFNTLIEAETERHEQTVQKIKNSSGQQQNEDAKNMTKALQAIVVGGIVNTVQKTVLALKNGENAFSAFGKAVLDLFGDLAIQIGTFFIAAGIAKTALFTDFTGGQTIAAGVALVAIGTIMKSLFGGSGSSATTGGGAGTISESPTETATSNLANAEDIKEKTTKVEINVAGTVLDPISVGRQISQILSDTFEATGTKVVTA